MKPILFAKNETNFTTNGLGRLDCISCEVVEERNGIYELEAEIPITGAHAKEIEMHSIIGVIPHEGSNIQAFYVYKIGKPISGRFRVYGRHISYRLTDIPCMPFSVAMSPQAAAQTFAGLKSNAIEACPFNFYTDITTPASYTQKTPASIRQRLGGVEGSVIDLFGGEFEWDNWNVRLLKARGRLANVTGISLRYGKNITDLDQEEEIANTVTGVVPFWVDTDGNNLVTLPEHAVYAPNAGSYPYHLTQVLDLSSEFQDKPTVAQLRNTATLYVNKSGFGVPKVSIKVSFVDLWKSEEYKDIAPLEQVRLCDEITVDFEKLGVKAIAKVVKTTYDVLKERYTQIEVGSIRTTLAQAITDRDKDIDSVYLDVMSRVTQAAQNATAWLTSANGYVVAVKNTDGSWKELLFMDSNDPATARNCLRINNNGLGFWSHDRYPEGSALDGPYDNAWTIDGNLIADFITTGDLKSQNYVAPTQATSPYAVSGMDLALNNGNITSEYFVLTQLGAFLKGTIEASGGKIGAAEITPYSIVIRGDIELYTGTGTFTFRPTDYYFVDDFVLTLTTEEGTTSSVTLIKHENGSDTTVGTYSVTDAGITTAYIDHTIGTEEEDYYQLTITGSDTQVLADDVILAYMGREGFRGTLSGIFRGYIDSRSGKIGDMKYNGQSFDLTFGSELRFNHGDDSIVLDFSNHTITRYYMDGGVLKSTDVAWGRKQNFISQELLLPEYPPTDDGDSGDLLIQPHEYKTGKDSLWRCNGGTSWDEVDLSGSWVTYSDSAPSQSQGKYGDVHLKFDSPAAVILGGGTLQSIFTHSGAATNPWVENSVGGGGGVNYSTEEQKTGITYTDSSPIYQRSYVFSTPVSLASNTWTNAIQTNHIAQVLSAEGSNVDGDMIGMICRVNGGYVQALNLMTASQSLSALTIRYIRVAGLYEFNDDYQTDGTYYTFAPMDKETFLSNFLRAMIKIAKSAGNQRIIDVATFIESHLNDIIGRLINTENTGAGVNINFYGGGNENCVIGVVNSSPYSGSTYITNRQTLNGYEYCETYMQMMAYYSSRARFNWNGSTFDVTYETGNYNTVQQIGYKVTTVSSLQISALSSNLGIHYV